MSLSVPMHLDDAPAHETEVSTPLLSILGGGIVIVSMFWFDFLNFTFSFPVPRDVLLVVGLGMCVAGVLARLLQGQSIKTTAFFWAMFSVNLFSFGLQVARGFSPQQVTFALSPVVAAILLTIGEKTIQRYIVLTGVFSGVLEIWETITQRFVYVFVAADGSSFDEKEFLGGAGNFRAKGLFPGPTYTTSFLIVGFLAAPGYAAFFSLVVGAALAFGRSGQLFAIWAFFATFSNRNTLKQSSVLVLVLLTIVGYVALTPFDAGAGDLFDRIVGRFWQAFDLNDSTNLSRLYYMQVGFEIWMSHDTITDIVFGFPRHSHFLTGFATENSTIQIGIEYGLVGVAVYAVGLVRYAVHIVRHEPRFLWCFIGLVIYMNTVSGFASLGIGTLFWIAVLKHDIHIRQGVSLEA